MKLCFTIWNGILLKKVQWTNLIKEISEISVYPRCPESLANNFKKISIFNRLQIGKQVSITYCVVFFFCFFSHMFLYIDVVLCASFVFVCVWWCPTHIVLFLFCSSSFCEPYVASFSGLSILWLSPVFLIGKFHNGCQKWNMRG
jgi:hypothetical protein